VPSLSWFGVATKMAHGPGEYNMRAICFQQLFAAVTAVLEQSKAAFVRSALPGWVRKLKSYQNINENKMIVTYYVIW
jgi:hypothetical protein